MAKKEKVKAEHSAEAEINEQKTDWNKIKTEYITGDISYRELAKKHGVPLTTLQKRAKKTAKNKGWVTLKSEYRDKKNTKVIQKIQDEEIKKDVNYIKRIRGQTERLIDKVDKAIEELNTCMIESETVIKTVEYNKQEHKPQKEITQKMTQVDKIEGVINTRSLKDIAAALEKLHGLLLITTEVTGDDIGIVEIPQMIIPTPPKEDDDE